LTGTRLIITTNELVAVDTNILIYLHDITFINKRTIAEEVLAKKPKISNQVLSEYLNVTRRLLKVPKKDLLLQTADLFSKCDIIPISYTTLILAADLVGKYHFQLFDSIIVASAIESNCDILYSEDMHHGLKVNNKLTILNPFL
jgi:predicted nucleic acid-binding protein